MSEHLNHYRPSVFHARRERVRRQEFYGHRAEVTPVSSPGETSARRAYEMLRTLLRSGELTTRDALAEDSLAVTLGASRNAVRKALQQLADEGLLIRQTKSGTRLVHEMIHVDGGQVVPRGMALGADRGRLCIEQTRTERVILSPVVRKRLETEARIGVLSESRFHVDDAPISLRVGYVAGDPDLVQKALRAFGTVNPPPYEEAFRQLYGAPFGSSHSTIEAIRCEARTAAILGVDEGAPILLNEVLVRDVDGVARELSYTYYRSDRVAISSMSSSLPHAV
ncbi:GntR family transcriptional regulator [Herbiconiux moechotypicola]|uniref:GntR family transcriptional regulator n=1 Tax=Herbiconiux moechotypicola TaxID=637393 RepID=A0ABP5QH72_9MICO|nr:GntR family transcriptional regulator [Herbiconiux moechotypicola]MCS5730058.1 GntR family transcriptional regulator [Herbiconiux moechotypicola]